MKGDDPQREWKEPITCTHIHIQENYLAVGAGLLEDSARENKQMHN